MRDLMRAGSSAVLLLTMMVLGGLVLWIGIPLLTLYVGSQVQSGTGSVGAALAVSAVVLTVGIVLVMWLLGWLSRRHAHARAARGLEPHGQVALEGIMAASATIAIIGFAAWFFIFSGASPFPLLGR
jgi:hypothetical protein